MYLLDTNILINLLKGDVYTLKKLKELPKGPLFISAITYMELLLGLQDSSDMEQIYQYLDTFICIPFSKETAQIAKNYFGSYTKRTIQKDVMIASSAIEKRMTLITSDKRFPVADALSLLRI